MIHKESKDFKSPRNKCLDINGNFCLGAPKSSKKLPINSKSCEQKKNRNESKEEQMERERKEKLEKKLMRLVNPENGKLSGGTLKIYGECLNPLLPYKSLLLSDEDTAEYVVGEMLDKYGIGREKVEEYCLVMCIADGKGVRLRRAECPLRVLLGMGSNVGKVKFEVIKRPTKLKNTPSNPTSKSNTTKEDGLRKINHSLPSYEDLVLHTNRLSVQRTSLKNKELKSSNIDVDENSGKTKFTHNHHGAFVDLRTKKLQHTQILNDQKLIPITTPPVPKHSNNESNIKPSYLAPSIDEKQPIIDPKITPNHIITFKRNEESRLSRHLPIQITYFRSKEADLIKSIICDITPNNITNNFRLSPAYTIHLMIIDCLIQYNNIIRNNSKLDYSQIYQQISLCLQSINNIVKTSASLIRTLLIQKPNIVSIQALWLSNCTELLHLLTNNRLIASFVELFDSNDYQKRVVNLLQQVRSKYYDLLAEIAQIAFDNISQHFRDDLVDIVPVMFSNDESSDDSPDQDDQPLPQKPTPITSVSSAPISLLVRTLSSCLSLLQLHAMNPALSIQLISRLLHILTAHSLNHLLSQITHQSTLSTAHHIATLIQSRLLRIQQWANRNELALAADCYLQPALQMCRLILYLSSTTNFSSGLELESLYSTCIDLDRLNSSQVHHVLEACSHKCSLPQIWIDFVVSGVSEVADKIQAEDGLEPTLWLSEDLNLPLLLPEDGYYIEKMHSGAPQGLVNFLDQLNRSWCYFKIGEHPHVFYDWLVESKTCDNNSQDDQSLISEHGDLIQNLESGFIASYRHQLTSKDFKINLKRTSPKNEDQSIDSALESGIEIDKNPSNYHTTSNPQLHDELDDENHVTEWSSDGGCSTTATSLFSDLLTGPEGPQYSGVSMQTHAGHFYGVRELRSNVEKGIDQINREWDQIKKSEEQFDRIYEQKLEVKMEEFRLARNQDIAALENHEIRTNERINNELKRYQDQKELDRILQDQRMKQIEINLGRSETFSGSNPPKFFVPVTQAMHHINSSQKKKKSAFVDRSRSHSAIGLSSYRNTDDDTPRKPRSLSSDRYQTLLTEDLDNLTFREKLDLFEFGISRSNR